MAKAPEPTPIHPPPHPAHAHPEAHAPAKAHPKLGEARVVPEYRAAPESSGQAVLPTRMADFPAEKEAGWKRFKASARQPGEATWPPAYLIAPDAKAAEEAYRKQFDVSEAGRVLVREMPD